MKHCEVYIKYKQDGKNNPNLVVIIQNRNELNFSPKNKISQIKCIEINSAVYCV